MRRESLLSIWIWTWWTTFRQGVVDELHSVKDAWFVANVVTRTCLESRRRRGSA